MKRFLKEAGHADQYKDLEIKWVGGAKPVLKVLDDDNEIVDQYDLAQFKLDEIHTVLQKHGFKRDGDEQEL